MQNNPKMYRVSSFICVGLTVVWVIVGIVFSLKHEYDGVIAAAIGALAMSFGGFAAGYRADILSRP